MLLVITFSFRCFEYETGLSGIFSNQIWPEWRSFLSKNIFAQYCTHWVSPNIELVAYLWYIRSSWLGDVVPIDADEVGMRLEVHDPVLTQPHLGFKDDYHSKISKMIIFQRWWQWKWHGEESSKIWRWWSIKWQSLSVMMTIPQQSRSAFSSGLLHFLRCPRRLGSRSSSEEKRDKSLKSFISVIKM